MRFEHSAPVVEAYPRAGNERTGADNIFFGTEPLFKRAGFEIVRGPLPDCPRNWLPRLAMRFKTVAVATLRVDNALRKPLHNPCRRGRGRSC